MPFKLTHSNKNGSISVVINKELTKAAMDKVCDLVANILADEGPNPSLMGPWLPNRKQTPSLKLVSNRLGQKPVDSINMGTYIEPDVGVRLKIVGLMSPEGDYSSGEAISSGRVVLIKEIHKMCGISIIGCMNIVMGNYPCPVMSAELAKNILERFMQVGVYAKIVPASKVKKEENSFILPATTRSNKFQQDLTIDQYDLFKKKQTLITKLNALRYFQVPTKWEAEKITEYENELDKLLAEEMQERTEKALTTTEGAL